MRNIVIVSLLCCSFYTSFSQQIQVKGVVTDITNNPLSFANIEVLQGKNNNFVTYGVSDEYGKYEVYLTKKGDYTFKVSYLGYKTDFYKKVITKNTTYDFVLKQDASELDEIVIKAKLFDVRIKNDTLKYNLNQFKTGSEENLKDILEKLPGLQISDNGKIKASGKTIDNLLIDGKEFFGEQHQLATENISSEMIEGIELLKNFKAFSDLKDFDKTKKTALNIKLKEKYKEKIGGDFLLEGGYNKKYLLHSNLYKFDKKLNWFFIADANNLGKQSFTLEDYISFVGIEKLLGNGAESGASKLSSDDLPSFLFSADDVKNRTAQFSAINLSFRPTKKINIKAYSIFNALNQEGLEEKNSTFFTPKNSTPYNEKISNTDAFSFNNTFLEMVYKPSENSILNYTATYTPLKNNLDKTIDINSTKINEIRDDKGFSFGHFLKYTQRIDERSFFSSSFYNNVIRKDNTLDIKSNHSFLELISVDSHYGIIQNVMNTTDIYGVRTKYTRKFKNKLSLDFSYNLTQNKDKYESYIVDNTAQRNDFQIKRIENIFGMELYKKDKTLFNYNFGFNYKITNTKIPDLQRVNNFMPKAEIKLNFSQTHNLSFLYKQDAELPVYEKLIDNNIISDYRTLFINKNVSALNLSKFNNFGIQYFYYDLFARTLFSLILDHNRGKNIISLDSKGQSNFITNNYVISPKNTNSNMFMLLDKKFSKIPFSLRFNGNLSFIENINYIENTNNKVQSKIVSGNVKISSLFKNSKINFETGIKIKSNNIKYQISNTEINLTNTQPYFNLNGVHKNLVWKADFLVEDYKTKNIHTVNYVLNPRIVYKNPKNKWEFSLSGNNILGIDKTERIENTNINNYVEERIYTALAGYAIFGIKYKL